MNKGIVQCDDTYIHLGMCGRSKLQLRKKSKDIVVDLPHLWKRVLGNAEYVYVETTAHRFSRTRQLVLAVNMLAHEYGVKIFFSRSETLTPHADLCQLAVQWMHVVAPLYAHEPNITKRKAL